MDRLLLAVLALLAVSPAQATMLLNGVGGVAGDWVLTAGGVAASIDLNCSSGQGIVSGTRGAPAALVTTTRATTAGVGSYIDDSTGNWVLVADNVLRASDKGCLIEEQRVNSLRNNSMQGAVVSAPGTCVANSGTLPTNWTIIGLPAGVFSQVVSTGTESGIDYIDVRFCGTPGSSTSIVLAFESMSQIAALQGQTWIGSAFVKLVGGALTNTSGYAIQVYERGAAGVAITNSSTAFTPLTTGVLGASRYLSSYTLPTSTAAFTNVAYSFAVTNGNPIDLTLRIGWPQLERVTLINSTGIAAGAQTITNSGTSTCVSGTYTVSGGTGTAATLTGVATAGLITSLTTLTAGNYTVFPTSPAALTGTGCSGAPTATLTAASVATGAYATSPLRTTTVAVTRNADVARVTGLSVNSPATIFGSGTSFIPSIATASLGSLDIAAITNRLYLYRAAAQLASATTTSGGTGGGLMTGAAWTANTPGKAAVAAASADQALSFNGAAVVTAASTWPPTTPPTQLSVGSSGAGGATIWNGYITRLAVWLTTRVSNANLQALTQ